MPLEQELAPAEAGGAPRIDGQDFADIKAYGVERWLAELALALRQETYRPEPISRLLSLPGVRANLVHDAHLAALAIEHGLILCSTDGDFARFSGLRWQNPLAA